MNPKIISYYTDSYADEMAALKATASELGLQVHATHIKGEPGWNAVVAMKPQIILDALESLEPEYGGILYSDADSRFRRVPEWKKFVHSDFACHFFKRSKHHEEEMLTGTMWFAARPHVIAFVKDWIKRTAPFAHTDTPEQRSLSVAFADWRKRLSWLPLAPGMCWIYDDFPAIYGRNVPITIEHLQASRTKRGGR